MENTAAFSVPEWVPEGALRYLEHTEAGRSIRDLARTAGCHASTVLRQIRRMETRRDDPLIDGALRALARTHFLPADTGTPSPASGGTVPPSQLTEATAAPGGSRFSQEASRVLRRLCESGAVLAVAENMDKAVVVRGDGAGGNTRTAVVDCAIAQALALKDWISCANPARISRYHITAAGRGALSRLLAEAENRARAELDAGFAEAQSPFAAPHRLISGQPIAGLAGDPRRRTRYTMAESPLIALSRRKDKDGKPFLDEALVRAGERLREDFELAQMGPDAAQNWDRFLTGGAGEGLAPVATGDTGSTRARDRVARALSDLGPGLSDVALRCCCFLEGLELAEKRMGWSARSGKIVLRIALQRLKCHYDAAADKDRMIG